MNKLKCVVNCVHLIRCMLQNPNLAAGGKATSWSCKQTNPVWNDDDTVKLLFNSILAFWLKILLCSLVPRGSAIARIIGSNAQKLQHFATTVKMWVYEEMVNDKKLSEIINTEHENVKYLPGYKLPENVVRS